ncbi:MAG: family 10 glycosylhydrolase [Aphanothece sp. CMT-3BRIN-NPC111]|nr:family 10 glycosylhydrolase [Aphanothece sp. CMT-3BRIN-NPC111]
MLNLSDDTDKAFPVLFPSAGGHIQHLDPPHSSRVVGCPRIYASETSRQKPLRRQRFYHGLLAALLTGSSFVSQGFFPQPSFAQTAAYCQFTKEAIAKKENLLKESLKGKSSAQKRYKTLLNQHKNDLQQCRSRTWPNNQAVWVRLYPCDIRPGVMDKIMDRIVNRGYNQVYVEVLGDNQVLLPAADNPTPWPSVVRTRGNENVDLLAQAIQKGRERGMRVYAWMFAINFGYLYSQLPDRQSTLARNGRGQTSVSFVPEGNQGFIDPYNQQAKADYYRFVQAVTRRRPDGILFDYIRYPRGSGADSVATKVQDLWIYGDAARQALYGRALNNKGRALIERYLNAGYISAGDIDQVDKLYPTEGSPLWQGRNPQPLEMQATPQERQPLLQWQLWQLSVAHAAQGILDFLAVAMLPAQQQGIKVGEVFFPEGNQTIGQGGYDSRLQPWDRFPSSTEWHPMAYGICGNTSCIEEQVKRVLNRASPSTLVAPVLAGIWGQPLNNRPSLEAQMQGIRQVAPQINTVSHFAFSWQEAQFDSERKLCRV